MLQTQQGTDLPRGLFSGLVCLSQSRHRLRGRLSQLALQQAVLHLQQGKLGHVGSF